MQQMGGAGGMPNMGGDDEDDSDDEGTVSSEVDSSYIKVFYSSILNMSPIRVMKSLWIYILRKAT